MSDIVFTILQSVITISIIVVMGYVIPYLRLKFKNAIDDALWKAIIKEVKSVEQTIRDSGMGKIKKEDVLIHITAWANNHNISITQEQISRLIESAVWVMKNEDEKKNG